MHKEIVKMSTVVKPDGDEVYLVYFSSISNNTHRFINKLHFKNDRIPVSLTETLLVDKDYVLVLPTYGGGRGTTKGAVPEQVIKFLNIKNNREHCKGVVASGNTNFGDSYCIAGPILTNKLHVPLLYQFELLGTKHDVETLTDILNNFWSGADDVK